MQYTPFAFSMRFSDHNVSRSDRNDIITEIFKSKAILVEADKALAGGSADGLVKFVTDAAAAGIKQRYERAAATFKHKDESVAAGREFVEAYIEYTHYVERLEQTATASAEHGKHHAEAKHSPAGHNAHH